MLYQFYYWVSNLSISFLQYIHSNNHYKLDIVKQGLASSTDLSWSALNRIVLLFTINCSSVYLAHLDLQLFIDRLITANSTVSLIIEQQTAQ